ncbi:MAG: lysophospholipid acyltransferase family protein [bacterium]
MSKNLYKFAATIFKAYFKLFYKMEVIGKENIPENGRLVVMANHITYLDPPLIGCIMLNRHIHFMAKEELFKYPVFAYLLKKIGQFPVKRGKPDRTALKKAFEILRNEEVLGIFPEGTTQGKGGKLRRAKSGAILIPIKAKSPILPVGIKFSGRKLKVSIGKPFTMEQYYGNKMTREDRKEVGMYIMNKIAEEIKKI